MQYTLNCIQHLFWLYNNHAYQFSATVKVAIKRGRRNLHSLHTCASNHVSRCVILKSHKSDRWHNATAAAHDSNQLLSRAMHVRSDGLPMNYAPWTNMPAPLHVCHWARSCRMDARCSNWSSITRKSTCAATTATQTNIKIKEQCKEPFKNQKCDHEMVESNAQNVVVKQHTK